MWFNTEILYIDLSLVYFKCHVLMSVENLSTINMLGISGDMTTIHTCNTYFTTNEEVNFSFH